MNKTLTNHHQRNWREYNNASKKKASLQCWLSEEVMEGWTKVERMGKRKKTAFRNRFAQQSLREFQNLLRSQGVELEWAQIRAV